MKLTDLASPKVASASEVSHVSNNFPESNLPFYCKLGRTDLTVSCLGLGGGGSISSEDTLYAFERGINYFFYSSDLHHYIYSSMSGALRQMCSRRSSVREKVILATVTYIKSPEMALAALLDQFVELNIDYIDVLFWGWIGSNDQSTLQNCLQLSPDLRGNNSVYQRTIERMFGASERLKKMGAVRYIGASFHDINLAQQCLHSDLLDVVMSDTMSLIALLRVEYLINWTRKTDLDQVLSPLSLQVLTQAHSGMFRVVYLKNAGDLLFLIYIDTH